MAKIKPSSYLRGKQSEREWVFTGNHEATGVALRFANTGGEEPSTRVPCPARVRAGCRETKRPCHQEVTFEGCLRGAAWTESGPQERTAGRSGEATDQQFPPAAPLSQLRTLVPGNADLRPTGTSPQCLWGLYARPPGLEQTQTPRSGGGFSVRAV